MEILCIISLFFIVFALLFEFLRPMEKDAKRKMVYKAVEQESAPLAKTSKDMTFEMSEKRHEKQMREMYSHYDDILSPEMEEKLRTIYRKKDSEWTWDDCVLMLGYGFKHEELCDVEEHRFVHAPFIIATYAVSLHFGTYACNHCNSPHCQVTYRSERFVLKMPAFEDVGEHPENWLLLCKDCYFRNRDNEYLFIFGYGLEPVRPRRPNEKPKYRSFSSMSPKEFEEFVARVFRRKGYTVKRIGGSGDNGVDLVMQRGYITAIVQCKRYKTNITPKMLREFAGAITVENAQEAYFVTSSDFSENAKKWAGKTSVILVNGQTLHEWWSDL